jgi:hypothetical protein
MELAIKNALKKSIPDIYRKFQRGISLDDIASGVTDDVVDIVNRKYKCHKCEEKIPQNNSGIEK